jgi:OFA family oxalate/formate antiporter-like MFS transporter
MGRNLTVVLFFTLQAANMIAFEHYSTIAAFLAGAAVAGCCYGSCASLFAAAAADCWGTNGFGLNYGMLFTAWGIGGIVGPLFAGHIADVDGNFGRAYIVAAVMLGVGALLAGLRQAGFPTLRFRPATTVRMVALED